MNATSSGLRECLVTQLRNVCRGVPYDLADMGCGCVVLTVVGMKILGVSEHNIKSRFYLGDTSNATWRFAGDAGAFDGVAVLYGPSADPGATWKDSRGNKYKDDYRRLAYGRDVSRHGVLPDCWNEIPWRLTEANLRLLIAGRPLRDRR